MKTKIVTIVCAVMLFVPWTIIPLRMFEWALQSPAAEIMISCYAAFMIFSAIFTVTSYTLVKARGNLMKVCLVVNCLYGIFGIAALGMMNV